MPCQKCKSHRILWVNGVGGVDYRIGEHRGSGAIPDGAGVGSGEQLDFAVCLACGQLQGEFPRPRLVIEGPADEKKWCRCDTCRVQGHGIPGKSCYLSPGCKGKLELM